jgi:hypothetical protein
MNISLFNKYEKIINEYFYVRNNKFYILDNNLYYGDLDQKTNIVKYNSNEDYKKMFEEINEIITVFDLFTINGPVPDFIQRKQKMFEFNFKKVTLYELWYRLQSDYYYQYSKKCEFTNKELQKTVNRLSNQIDRERYEHEFDILLRY